MKKLLFLTLLSVALPTVGVAQSDFRPGYIVQPAGDTLRGEVDYRGEQRNTRLCSFRPAPGAAPTDYRPEQLRGYGFADSKRYQTRQLAGSPPVAVFAQVLVGGKVSLFRLTDNDGREVYYAGTAPTEPLRLLQQRDTVISQNVRQRVYPFRNVLRGLMLDCPAVQAQLARTELLESQLVKVFTTYNSCVGVAPQLAVKRSTKVSVMLLGGVHRASLKHLPYGDEKMTSQFTPTFGAGIQFSPGRFNHKLSVLLQALYVQQKFDHSYQTPGEGLFLGEQVQRSVHVDLAAVHIPAMLRYTLPRGAVRPYVQVGALFALNMRAEGSTSTTTPRFNSVSTQEIEMRSTNYGLLLAGAGVLIPVGKAGGLQLEVRGQQLDNASKAYNTLSGTRGVSLLAGYSFGNAQR